MLSFQDCEINLESVFKGLCGLIITLHVVWNILYAAHYSNIFKQGRKMLILKLMIKVKTFLTLS